MLCNCVFQDPKIYFWAKIEFFGKQFEDTAALLDECPDI